MPIRFEPISNKPNWVGSTWSIVDDNELAELIARVALGQHNLVERILENTDCRRFVPATTALANAKRLLTVPDGKDPWHRDGWLFQVISWIAATLQSNGGIVHPPHMIHAHKGFDGLEVHFDPDTQRVRSLVISEDKATGNPRKMVRDKVLPELSGIQAGDRDNELVAAIPMMLRGMADPEEIDEALEAILWSEVRAFRIAITVDKKDNTNDGQKALFKGYDKIGDLDFEKRRAETFGVEALRTWMADMAACVLEIAEELEAENV